MQGSLPFVEVCNIYTGVYKHCVNHVIATL